MPRPGGFQPLKKDQRKLAPGPQVQAANRGRAVGQQKVLAQALRNQGQAKDKRQSVGPTAKVALPPKSGALKQLLAMKDEQMQRKRKPRKMRERKSLIPPQSRL